MLNFQVIIYKRTPHGISPRKDTNTQNAFFWQNMQDLYLLHKDIHYMAKTGKMKCHAFVIHAARMLQREAFFLIFLFF